MLFTCHQLIFALYERKIQMAKILNIALSFLHKVGKKPPNNKDSEKARVERRIYVLNTLTRRLDEKGFFLCLTENMDDLERKKVNYGHSNIRLLLPFPTEQTSGIYVFLLNLIKAGFLIVITIHELQSAKAQSIDLKHIFPKKLQ